MLKTKEKSESGQIVAEVSEMEKETGSEPSPLTTGLVKENRDNVEVNCSAVKALTRMAVVPVPKLNEMLASGTVLTSTGRLETATRTVAV